jgi:ubiquinone/menaquinone biosynthesis C-methylase UbiE
VNVSSSHRRPRVHRIGLVGLALLLLAGCALLKQCAYEGFYRDRWQQPQQVVEALAIRPGDHIADLGSGSGYFTFRLAQAVGTDGKVYAVDIDSEMNELVAQRAKEEGIGNVEVILARSGDPLLPSTGVDLVFSVNTYHHFENRVVYFQRLRKYLRPGGRIAVIDFDRRAWLEGLFRHYTPAEFIKREMEQAGYALQQELTFLDRQSFLILVPGPSASGPAAHGIDR